MHRGVVSKPPKPWPPIVLGLLLLPLACSEEPAADDGAAGTAGSGAHAGSASGSAGLGGTAGSLGGGAGAGTAGLAGSAGSGGTALAGAGGNAAGTAGSGGTVAGSAGALSGAGGGPSGGSSGSGGATGGDAGVAGTITAGGTTNGGSAGTAGAPGDDRCDIANYDAANPPESLTLSGSLGAHDPVVIEAHDQFYLFHTGLGEKTSSNLTSWQGAPAVFSSNPSWIAQSVPGVSNLWAPDISYFGGQYHLYYSASTFGDNRSCIGHATRAQLNSGSWTDHGAVVCSNVDSDDNWNAIDPNVIVDLAGTPWLSFGSFWGGLKMIELTQQGERANDTLIGIAARPQNNGALEAPFIIRRCGYYYLFASFDTCCQGVNSTYKTMVGRSTEVTGPYADKDGTPMMMGGGTLILQGGTRYKGPGHNAVIFTEDAAYNVYHSYDANANGQSVLRIAELVFDAEGWPISAGP